ncbi:glutathione S-transferase family protein [Catenovulum sp. SM1970]|uniref:glutathione S-transferase family protein n=1 Tax=Marinifaba aquimaris TaxID=2741323 RepID=UPI0015748D8D|nr:glutathione S-transferase family protein [Marinifaba aquimaris]NTS76285.1 glutathione S-transferase family protein [Marinifaba aquimaris]
MYRLYYFPNACSLAIQVLLRELNQPFELIDKNAVDDFSAINPTGSVPALEAGGQVYTEGASLIHLLVNRHAGDIWPTDSARKERAVEAVAFANATVHPAYSKLFFILHNMPEGAEKQALLQVAADRVSQLWQIVEDSLTTAPFIGGDSFSPADILLAVYARWNAFFDVDIQIGQKTQAMLSRIYALDSFKASLAAEAEHSAEQVA